jgi:ribonuclease HII
MLRRAMLNTFYNKNLLEAGIDEAGRGPLFGRVYTAAVIIPNDDTFKKDFIKDSKKLSKKKREFAYDFIINNAVDYAISYKEASEIDYNNIYNSTFDCMHNSLDNLIVKPDFLLVDGSEFQLYMQNDDIVPHRCFVKGDGLYASIAAASILAKVSHDKYIEEMCKKTPLLDEFYGLSSNMGYGTKIHMNGIKQYGISPWHRKSFSPCKNIKINKKFKNN